MTEKTYLEDLRPGQKTISQGRTITEADIVMFAGISGDWNVLHTNAEYMKKSIFGQRIAHGMLTLSIAFGLAIQMRSHPPIDILAFLGIDNLRFKAPVFIGDTIKVDTEVAEARPSKKRTYAGVVKFINTVRNQRDEVVATWETALLVSRQPKKK